MFHHPAPSRISTSLAPPPPLQCSPANEARAMLRLLRVTEGDPPVILRFLGSPADTPREVLERAQTAIRRAMKGDVEREKGVEEAGTASGGKGGKNGGYA